VIDTSGPIIERPNAPTAALFRYMSPYNTAAMSVDASRTKVYEGERQNARLYLWRRRRHCVRGGSVHYQHQLFTRYRLVCPR
jgi:hypothetical protein